jgi:hypothetical protein
VPDYASDDGRKKITEALRIFLLGIENRKYARALPRVNVILILLLLYGLASMNFTLEFA